LLHEALWGGSGDEYASGLALDYQGNILAGATTDSFDQGNYHTALLKFNSNGNIIWQRIWGGTGQELLGNLAVDALGTVYLAGSTSSFPPGTEHVFILKVDGNGNLVWQETLQDPSMVEGRVALDSSGNVYVAGDTLGSVALTRLDLSGALVWQRVWGSFKVRAFGVATDPSGNILVTGSISGATTGYFGAFLLKFDSSGNLAWQRVWGVTGDAGQGVSSDPSGNIYVTGYHNTTLGGANQDAFLLKISPSGDLLWQHTWGGGRWRFPANVGAQFMGFAVAVNTSGVVFVTGSATMAFSSIQSDTCVCAFLLELDSAGELLSQKIWGGPGNAIGHVVALTQDGYVVVAGGVDHNLHYSIGTTTVPLAAPSLALVTPTISPSNVSATVETISGGFSTPPGIQSYGGGSDVFLLFVPIGTPPLAVYEGLSVSTMPHGERDTLSVSIQSGNDLVFNASVSISTSDPSLVPRMTVTTNSTSYAPSYTFDVNRPESLWIAVSASEPGFASVLDQRQFGVGPPPPIWLSLLVGLLSSTTLAAVIVAATVGLVIAFLSSRRRPAPTNVP
jgi:hypothetical protein